MIDAIEKPRRRALVLAFMCSPDHGSEWGIGWNRVVECAKHFDTWVICQGDGQAVEIERYLQKHGPIAGLHFEFISYRGGADYPTQVKRFEWLAYRRWHRQAFRRAQELHAIHHFDFVHQATNTGFREPGDLWKLDAPFVWGPIGGMHSYPWRFLGEAGWRYGLAEAVRNVLNYTQLHWSRRPRQAARRASAILVSNSSMCENFRRVQGVPAAPLMDVGISSVAGCHVAPRDDAQHLRIFWCGQFLARKALSLLLKALAALPPDVDFTLRIVGGGPTERRWQKLARRLGVSDHVEWLGWLPHRETLKQYEWADVFAFTSLRDNSGTVILEALGNGLPVVCLDHQGAHDIVTESCGFKVPVESPEQVVAELSDALARLARDPKLREQMGRAAVQRAGDYLWTALGAQMTDVFRSTLKRNGAASAAVEPTTPRAAGADDPDAPPEPAVIPRDRLREVVTRAAERAAVGLHRLGGDARDDGFGILMYHRVADKVPGLAAPTNNVTPRKLREQLAGLLARGFQAWPLQKVLRATAEGTRLPPKVFVVTFDDGYENNLLTALPILEDLQVPATIFLATGFLDSQSPMPSDDWPCAGRPEVPPSSWRPLTTAQCHELQDSGLIELGAHTHTHQFFLNRPAVFRRDLTTCLEVLEQRFGIVRPSFAFPFGMMDEELIETARDCGVCCALSVRSERVRAGDPPFTWGRFSADNTDTVATLAAKLNGWYTPVATGLRTIKRPIGLVAGKVFGRKPIGTNPSVGPAADGMDQDDDDAAASTLEESQTGSVSN